MLTIAKDNIDNKEMLQDALSKIELSANFLTGLINDILDFNKLASGKLVFNNKPMDLRTIPNNIKSVMGETIDKSNMPVQIHDGEILHPYVLGSILHIQQILMNLLGNAIKYNKKNGNIHVGMREISCKDNIVNIEFTVADEGIGMSEHIPKPWTIKDVLKAVTNVLSQ